MKPEEEIKVKTWRSLNGWWSNDTRYKEQKRTPTHTRLFARDNKQKQLFVLPNQAFMRHPLQLRKAETQVPGVCVCVWKNFQFFLLFAFIFHFHWVTCGRGMVVVLWHAALSHVTVTAIQHWNHANEIKYESERNKSKAVGIKQTANRERQELALNVPLNGREAKH